MATACGHYLGSAKQPPCLICPILKQVVHTPGSDNDGVNRSVDDNVGDTVNGTVNGTVNRNVNGTINRRAMV
ncbi:MAG: hypothetical protein R2867_11510 [Caldilineaceae bacterium]